MGAISLYSILVTIHQLGLDIGLGTCTVTYAVSTYGLFKPSIMPQAASFFKLFSLLIWVGLALLVISGIGLSITSREVYGEALKGWPFYVKLIFVGIATLNGLYLNFIVTPAIEKAVKLEDFAHTKEYFRAMVLGLIGGFISATSWYGSFFFGIYVFKFSV